MKLKGKRILIISPDSWGFIKMSKHHYALELAKDNEVFFLGPPNKSSSTIETSEGVNIIKYLPLFKGINKVPFIWLKRKLMSFEIRRIEKFCQGEFDVVWSFDSSRLYYLDLFGTQMKIAHIVDHRENFYLEELVLSSDLILASSDSIIERINEFGKQASKIQHGYIESIEKTKVDLPGENKIKGIYVGNLDIVYFDWKILKRLAETRSDVDFILVGPISEDNKDKIYNWGLENVRILPKIESSLIYSFLLSSDFCFQIYDVEMYPEQLQNPHKTMQYIGSGRPIFSSFTYEYSNLNLLFFYSKESLETDFERFLNELSALNSEKERARRVSYALGNTYKHQIERIENLINRI
ncbi:MAG: hypothetical protein H6598_01615 [Flavobacteriales bacterium]|nr:hypothetical protein [Flavobacteriales bacterium]